ncbi:hypothetical protein DH2020_008169 [Rehmannia glutinosa]|uniref:Protein kinase domain-containing protein n=1 Tax=Rehmannia glutinosa TaxID=99300 RepID=A0ABR0U196_REHGL
MSSATHTTWSCFDTRVVRDSDVSAVKQKQMHNVYQRRLVSANKRPSCKYQAIKKVQDDKNKDAIIFPFPGRIVTRSSTHYTLFSHPCTTQEAATCNQTCGAQKLPFPFGFSSGCQIRLNCTANATILAADFPVQSIIGDTILINLPATCGRPVEALRRLFTQNFAPNSRNAILMQNCNARPTACFIPTTMVRANFQLLDCGERMNDSISCYSEAVNNGASFIDYGNLTRSGCRTLFSAISMESFGGSSAVSLDVQMVRVGWWLLGECRCSDNASCFRVSPPVEGNPAAYRCQCEEGFAGDGFRDGLGCRKGMLPFLLPINFAFSNPKDAMLQNIYLDNVEEQQESKRRNRTKKSRQLFKTAGITIPIHPYKEIEKATDNFSDKRKLGNGAYGTVYSGKLNTDEWVAIKRIKNRDGNSIVQFINEIKLLSSVSHPNLVRLLETAQAISYLHNSIHPPIYHRDIKSSNILLDYNYKSKVADFGLSRLGLIESSHISTAPQGTPGYLDPQYHQNFQLSDKSDVYSFGVVLIEIITGLRVVDFSRPSEEINLAAVAVDRIGRGCLDEIIDPFILGGDRDNWTISSVDKVAELAFRCLAFHRDMRPSMMEVAVELEQIRRSKWTESEMSVTTSDSSSSDYSKKSLNPTVENECQAIQDSCANSRTRSCWTVGAKEWSKRTESPDEISPAYSLWATFICGGKVDGSTSFFMTYGISAAAQTNLQDQTNALQQTNSMLSPKDFRF